MNPKVHTKIDHVNLSPFIKMLKVKDKERILKTAREKQLPTREPHKAVS